LRADSLEPEDTSTVVTWWLVLDISIPAAFRSLRRVITARFDKENLRTVAAVREYAEVHGSDGAPGQASGPPPRIASAPSSHPGA
jgi:hypothetical protein